MKKIRQRTAQSILFLGLTLLCACGPAHILAGQQPGANSEASTPAATGFLLVAPDRGFLGNEETRAAFAQVAGSRNARLVFATDERTRTALETALAGLAAAGAGRVALLPFFLSTAHPRWVLVEELLNELDSPIPVLPGRSFGESYLAVEVLADRFRAIREPAGRKVIVVGYGARDAESRRRMEADWQRLADLAAEGFGFESVRALVGYATDSKALEAEVERELQQLAGEGERPTVVPFHLGKKLDSMMAFTVRLKRLLPKRVDLVEDEVTPHPAVATWMAREANRFIPLHPEEIGVVFLAHGSDYHWNETMRQAVHPLTRRYKVEFAFCMADPPLVEQAVRRLEQRGARAIVVVRVFGLTSSFQGSVERMLGLDVERSHAAETRASHGHGHSGPPRPRIHSAALMATTGGLEDHPLFARALLDRARELSRDPSRETVILVAHGTEDDHRNDHWRQVLNSLAEQVRAGGGTEYRAIRTATWREDWPDKREPEVAAVRRMVEEAVRDGGRAIVIPARTTGQGSEERFLEGLQFDLSTGFAPHPLFARWVEEQIHSGIAVLEGDGHPGSRLSASAYPRAGGEK